MTDNFPVHRLSLGSIEAAARFIDPIFLDTPQFSSERLDDRLECRLLLKVETINPIRSFKGRGACFFLSRLTGRGDSRPLVCASTGNFGQAMAYACRAAGRDLMVFADVNANPLKVDRMRAMGAVVRLAGNDFDTAKREAKRHCVETGSYMVEDGLEPEVSEGAGTIGVELLARSETPEVVLVPLGNGALINGVARWVKATSPGTLVIGVCASGADSMEKSWRTGEIVENDSISTVAEGIAVRVPIPEAVEDMRGIVDDVVLVNDDMLLEAMRAVFETTGILVEPAGAAGVAAVMADSDRFSGGQHATVLTGGNVTPEQIDRWL